MLVVGFSALRLNVLLNSVNLGLIVNELLLNIIQAVEYLTLQNLVLRGIMLHRMIGDLLAQVVLVDIEESFDQVESIFLLVEFSFEFVSLGEFVGHVVLHRRNLLLSLLHFLQNSTLKVLDFLEIALNLLLVDLQSCSRSLRIFKLSLFELKIVSHFSYIRSSGQLVFSCQGLLHVLK